MCADHPAKDSSARARRLSLAVEAKAVTVYMFLDSLLSATLIQQCWTVGWTVAGAIRVLRVTNLC
jgi:hypothetical protein